MFSRLLSLAILAVSFTAATASKHGDMARRQNAATCGVAQTVTATVTATATAAASTSTDVSGGNAGGNNGNNGGNNGNNGGNNNAGNGGAAGNDNAGQGNNNAGNGGAAGSDDAGDAGADAGGDDPQTSLTLDPRVIAQGFANDGQDEPVDGQVASLTSTNNFINFCLTVPDLPITDGKQITSGSCNPAPIGVIPSTNNMPSAKFTFPDNFGTVTANTAFTVTMAVNNFATGNFVNAQKNYFAAPQTLDGSGNIIGHSHFVIEEIDDINTKTVSNPQDFAFFKGVNAPAVNGVLSADVTAGVPAGSYRLCSINSSSNHQPVIVPVAQHGSLDDCIYFTSA